jgi:hypothetical protein
MEILGEELATYRAANAETVLATVRSNIPHDRWKMNRKSLSTIYDDLHQKDCL